MGDSDKKVVRFDVYCEKCEYWNDGKEIPYCDDCLQVSMRHGTEKPVKFKEK